MMLLQIFDKHQDLIFCFAMYPVGGIPTIVTDRWNDHRSINVIHFIFVFSSNFCKITNSQKYPKIAIVTGGYQGFFYTKSHISGIFKKSILEVKDATIR